MNVENQVAMNLVLASLRYWVQVIRVDGFRFDVASILARVQGQFSQSSLFFESVSKDPILSKVKMIAEPWDLSPYQVGNFSQKWRHTITEKKLTIPGKVSIQELFFRFPVALLLPAV